MKDKEKIHQILSSLWKNDDSVGKTYYNQALQDVQTAIDLQEETVIEDIFDMSRIDYRLQHNSIEDGIKYHAEEYSFNIESELFHQLTGEQQKLWRKELERAVTSGCYCGLELSRDKRYKEEPVSEDLEEVAKYYIPSESYHMIIESEGEGSGENMYDYKQLIDMFKNGVQWQKNHF